MAISLLIVVAFVLAAYLYRSLPQLLNKLDLKRTELSAGYRPIKIEKLKAELASYESALKDPPAFQAQALHLVALIVVSGIMTVLMVALFIAAQLLRLRWPDAEPIHFAIVDVMLAGCAILSLIGFRLAVFRSWIFLHPTRNLRRLQGTVARLEAR